MSWSAVSGERHTLVTWKCIGSSEKPIKLLVLFNFASRNLLSSPQNIEVFRWILLENIVNVSLSPSCVTWQTEPRKKWPCEILGPQDFTRPFFFRTLRNLFAISSLLFYYDFPILEIKPQFKMYVCSHAHNYDTYCTHGYSLQIQKSLGSVSTHWENQMLVQKQASVMLDRKGVPICWDYEKERINCCGETAKEVERRGDGMGGG